MRQRTKNKLLIPEGFAFLFLQYSEKAPLRISEAMKKSAIAVYSKQGLFLDLRLEISENRTERKEAFQIRK